MTLLRLEMHVRRAFGDALGEHVGDEAHDRRVLVGFAVGRRLGLDGQVLALVVEAAGTDAVVLVDQLGHALGRGEEPLRAARGEGRDPIHRGGVRGERGDEVEAAFGRAGEDRRDHLGLRGDAGRQDLEALGVDGGLREHLEAGEAGELGEQRGLVEVQRLGEQPEAGLARGLREGGAGLVAQPLGEGARQAVLVCGEHGHFCAGAGGT